MKIDNRSFIFNRFRAPRDNTDITCLENTMSTVCELWRIKGLKGYSEVYQEGLCCHLELSQCLVTCSEEFL